MFSAKQYLLAQSLEEAYVANQKRTATIVGGMCWLKMGKRQMQTLIDLSALGLDEIAVTKEGFSIGAMVSLRQLETHKELNQAFCNAFAKALSPIVGVQFRNCATVGGSVWGRFGFSDVITLLLALDAQVELYPSGVIALEDFIKMPYDKQILVRILIPHNSKPVAVQSHRNTATDFPVLVVTASVEQDGTLRMTVGARPQKAVVVPASLSLSDADLNNHLETALDKIPFGKNMRAGKEFRRHLASVLLKRAIAQLKEEQNHAN